MKEFYPKNGRVILHVDMNSFFASVEMAYDPSLKGKPLAIAGDAEKRRGIVVTCSYEARKFGVKTTMPVWEAKKLCPQLIVKQPNFERYRTASQMMFEQLREVTEWVEPISIDEGYMDITNCYHLGKPTEIAKAIQQNLMKKLDLPSSIGIAPNKFLAKMASDMKKPLGITILRLRDIEKIIWPLPIIEMHGVGEKTAEKLATLQVDTIGDLAQANDYQLNALLGIRGQQLKERANGHDQRPVDPAAAQEHKTIGSSTTLPRDITNQVELLNVLESLAKSVSERLKRKAYVSNNISVTIRYKNRKTISRSRKLVNPVIQADEIFAAAKRLFNENWNGDPVRLLGITGQDLIEEDSAFEQLDLFSYKQEAQKEPLYKAMAKMKNKYGPSIVQKGIRIRDDWKHKKKE
ncbi:DNA polymerase IV [Bacillus sp. FJAT-50079]|uniref:DNA polymerase IV n=1 Tax=Bacillus sp. FJAT-50079 TaxID=2833577 RepID=UPI001BC9F16B|nr:DNA polymerase IV [Bacillus sp. FJAT-50079]MBS4209672.1 DNA polymerase IV [Bacillus sp. FJAT-50079]